MVDWSLSSSATHMPALKGAVESTWGQRAQQARRVGKPSGSARLLATEHHHERSAAPSAEQPPHLQAGRARRVVPLDPGQLLWALGPPSLPRQRDEAASKRPGRLDFACTRAAWEDGPGMQQACQQQGEALC